jgi:hypothetical protein
MTLTTSMLVWATLTAALPGGPVHLLDRGPRAAALAEFVRARGRAAWGAEALTEQAAAAHARVLMVDTSSTSVAIEIYGADDLLASRVLDAEPLELGLLEGWLLVRATLERLDAPGPTPRAVDEARAGDAAVLAAGTEPAGAVTASTSVSDAPAVTAALAPSTAEAASSAPPAREPRALELPEAQLGVGPVEVLAPEAAEAGAAPVRIEVDEDEQTPSVADGAPALAATPSPSAAGVPPTEPAEPSAADEALATLGALGEASVQALRVVDAWGVVFASQLAGAPSAGLAVQARKVVGSSVWLTARVGLELSSPLTTVSTTRLPMTAMVGWVPAPELPLELGVQVQLTPLFVSSDDTSLEGGLGLGFALGGYGRGTWGVGPVDLFAELALGAPLLRQSYVTTDETASDPVLDFRMALGVEWRWP